LPIRVHIEQPWAALRRQLRAESIGRGFNRGLAGYWSPAGLYYRKHFRRDSYLRGTLSLLLHRQYNTFTRAHCLRVL
jgi:hypothetical protein